MFVLMTLVYPYFTDEVITTKKVVVGLVLWVFGGLAFGWATKKNSLQE